MLFVAWGEQFIAEVNACMASPRFPDYPVHLLTDRQTPVSGLGKGVTVHRVDFNLEWKTRKAEMVRCFPSDEMTFLFIDTDVQILGDLSLGFEKAEKFGIAMAQAAHYSMDHFKNFAQVMSQEGVQPKGQLLYNSGVIFFHLTPSVRRVFEKFQALALTYPDAPWGDQTYLTLAMELLDFNPYTLSTGYNHRAFGELISGEVRVWHSRNPVPENINSFSQAFPRVYNGKDVVINAVPKP